MAKTPSKVLILGIDSPVASRIYNWAKSGQLPALRKLIDDGVYCSNCLVPFPTITPPNWTTIATGAWAGTHGITDFDVHNPGDPLDKTHQGFDSTDVLAETLWQAGERAGKRSIVLNWPTTWPPTVKDGYQVAGFGLNITDWRKDVPIEDLTSCILAHDLLLSAEYYPLCSEVVFEKAKGWDGVEHSPDALEAEVPLRLRRTNIPMEPVTWHLLIDRSDGGGYDTVVVAKAKSKAGVYARLKTGEWSPNIEDQFDTADGPRKAAFRLKLLELSPDAQQFRLYVPGIFALEGWGHPTSLEKTIVSENGLPTARTAYEAFLAEWIDGQTLLESYDLHHRWLVDATKCLFANPWDMYFLHVHTVDWAYHTFSVELEPLVAYKKEQVPVYEDLELKLHQSMDKALGEIVEAAGEDTLVVVISDHGVKARNTPFHVEDVLEQAGLQYYLPAEAGQSRKIDWSRSRAVAQRTVHIYVSLKGCDPDGIVEPGEEYEQVRDQVIKALHEYVDPKTGLKPISLALRKEDARVIGLYGDRVGDVIYAIDPRFGKEHGPHLTTSRFGFGDLHGLCIMAGPGIKRGKVIERNVWLTDVAPTVCYLTEIRVPKQCEGGIIYQALDDPDARLKELQALRKDVEGLKKMVERPPMY